MDDVRLSVIVPMYNASAYIEHTLNSLVHQTLDGIEIIVIDDGSTDDSLEKVKRYAEAYPNITWVHQDDLGQANAVNRGLRMARGEYVAECDSDDFVALTCYQKAYHLATDLRLCANNADVVRFGWYGVHKNGVLEPIYYDNRKEYIGVPIDPLSLRGEDQIVVFGKMAALFAGIYRREFLLENNLFWREDRNFEDTSIEFKVRSLAKDYRIINEPLYYYRRDNPNSGNATIFDDDGIFEQFDEIDRFIAENEFYGLQGIANAMRYMTIMRWAIPRGQQTPERIYEMVTALEESLKDRPSDSCYIPDYKDWINFNLIRSGAWRDAGLLK